MLALGYVRETCEIEYSGAVVTFKPVAARRMKSEKTSTPDLGDIVYPNPCATGMWICPIWLPKVLIRNRSDPLYSFRKFTEKRSSAHVNPSGCASASPTCRRQIASGSNFLSLKTMWHRMATLTTGITTRFGVAVACKVCPYRAEINDRPVSAHGPTQRSVSRLRTCRGYPSTASHTPMNINTPPKLTQACHTAYRNGMAF